MRLADLMENTAAYRLWQLPWARKKFAPITANNNLATIRRVLDVGCGPGTNSGFLAHADYLGMDINPEYVDHARRKFRLRYLVADATTHQFAPEERFDFILLNSLLHHIDDGGVRALLGNLARQLAPGGQIHVIDLVLPEERSLARTLALADRGRHARSLERWREMFTEHFRETLWLPYGVGSFGLRLWNLIYFRGEAR